jgi:hypothetical protein
VTQCNLRIATGKGEEEARKEREAAERAAAEVEATTARAAAFASRTRREAAGQVEREALLARAGSPKNDAEGGKGRACGRGKGVARIHYVHYFGSNPVLATCRRSSPLAENTRSEAERATLQVAAGRRGAVNPRRARQEQS